MDKTWPHLFNATVVVLTLLLGEQLGVVSSCSHACLSAPPASVYLLVKLINWFGTWLACAARPKGLVSGVLIGWVLGSGFASIWSKAFSESARWSRATANGRGLSPLARVVSLEGRGMFWGTPVSDGALPDCFS